MARAFSKNGTGSNDTLPKNYSLLYKVLQPSPRLNFQGIASYYQSVRLTPCSVMIAHVGSDKTDHSKIRIRHLFQLGEVG